MPWKKIKSKCSVKIVGKLLILVVGRVLGQIKENICDWMCVHY